MGEEGIGEGWGFQSFFCCWLATWGWVKEEMTLTVSKFTNILLTYWCSLYSKANFLINITLSNIIVSVLIDHSLKNFCSFEKFFVDDRILVNFSFAQKFFDRLICVVSLGSENLKIYAIVPWLKTCKWQIEL